MDQLIWQSVALLGGSFFVSLLLNSLVRRVALRSHALSYPDTNRRYHDHPIPEWGGLGIGLTLLLGIGALSLTGHGFVSPAFAAFFVSILCLLVTGLWDDRYGVPAALRSGVYLFACALPIIAGVRIEQISFPGLGAIPFVGVMSLLATTVWLLSMTAATKFSDGVDGLVTGSTIIGFLLMGGLCLLPAFFEPNLVLVAAIGAGAFAGFLPLNLPPAKQYLGESGSTIAGFALAFLAIVTGAKLAIAMMALALPTADIARVMMERIRAGKHPLQGDRSHLHHLLLDGGWSAWQVLLLFWGISVITGIVALQVRTSGKVALTVFLLALPFFIAAWKRRRIV